MAIEGEILPSVQEKTRAALDACKALYAADVWVQTSEGVGVLANNVLAALAQEQNARVGEALSALRMRRVN